MWRRGSDSDPFANLPATPASSTPPAIFGVKPKRETPGQSRLRPIRNLRFETSEEGKGKLAGTFASLRASPSKLRASEAPFGCCLPSPRPARGKPFGCCLRVNHRYKSVFGVKPKRETAMLAFRLLPQNLGKARREAAPPARVLPVARSFGLKTSFLSVIQYMPGGTRQSTISVAPVDRPRCAKGAVIFQSGRNHVCFRTQV